MWADGYTIFDNGDIEKTSEEGRNADGENEYDVLYNENGDDRRTIFDTSILPSLAEEQTVDGVGVRMATVGDDSDFDAFQIWKFCADNSNVEWGLYSSKTNGNNEHTIVTSQDVDGVPSGKFLGLNSQYQSVHSHPSAEPNLEAEYNSMGIIKQGNRTYTVNTGNYSDRGSVLNDMKDGIQDINSYVYMKKSQRLYNIQPSAVPVVSPVNNSYFGVLF